MPYKSKAQRAYLHIHEPAVAAKWDSEMSHAQQMAVPATKKKHETSGRGAPKSKEKKR